MEKVENLGVLENPFLKTGNLHELLNKEFSFMIISKGLRGRKRISFADSGDIKKDLKWPEIVCWNEGSIELRGSDKELDTWELKISFPGQNFSYNQQTTISFIKQIVGEVERYILTSFDDRLDIVFALFSSSKQMLRYPFKIED